MESPLFNMPPGIYKHKPNQGFQKGNKIGVGNKNWLWKGEGVSYAGMHKWVTQWKGSPKYCENCGVLGKKNGKVWSIHWANIDHKYRRVLDDYIALCVKCHRGYDRDILGVKLGRSKVNPSL